MRRREFITLIGGAAAAWPVAARAQQERMRRIAMLTNLAESDLEERARRTAFLQGMEQLGWFVGRNLLIDYRSSLGEAERARRYAASGGLVSYGPDFIDQFRQDHSRHSEPFFPLPRCCQRRTRRDAQPLDVDGFCQV
jgi:putative ABC transport system substrate-binding protein